MIHIPNFGDFEIEHIVCDYNGTIAKDGQVLEEVEEMFGMLHSEFRLHVITADTFGSVERELREYGCEIKILSSDNHTREKGLFIESLGATRTVAIGNGNNDEEMLKKAAIGIALLGEEGCSKNALLASDMVCKNITEALELLRYPKRLIATLRR